MIELILGGARSGKSKIAEARAAKFADVVYMATANQDPDDAEMSRRIQAHIDRRPKQWTSIHAPLALSASLEQHAKKDRCILVDCLTLWLNNQLYPSPERWDEARQHLLRLLPELPGTIILVSNEIGQGVTPPNAVARQFIDLAGELHQDIAAVADTVTFCIAGLEQHVKAINLPPAAGRDGR